MVSNMGTLYDTREWSHLRNRLKKLRSDDGGQGGAVQSMRSAIDELSTLLVKIEHGEREWQDAFDAVQDPIFLHDQDYRVLRANRAYARMARLPVQEVIGRHYWDAFPKGTGPLPACCDLLAHACETQHEEITLEDGRIYLSRGFAVRDGDGEYLYSVHVMEEVTEHRRLQAKLAESEGRYRGLFESAPDAIVVIDVERGSLIDANPAAERLTGHSRRELLGLDQSRVFVDAESLITRFHDASRDEDGRASSPAILETRIQQADGRELPVEISAHVFRLGGRLVVQGMFRDISVRLEAETRLAETGKQLHLSLNLLTGIIESIPIRVFWKDQDLKFLGCNTLLARDAGLERPEQLIGKTDLDMPWREQADRYRRDDLEVIETGRARLGYEEIQTTPQGRTIWLRTSKVPLRDRDRNIIGVLGIYDDITEQRRAQQDLMLSESRLKESQAVAHLGSWELDLVKNELWWSDENYRIFGVEPGSGNNYRTFLDVVHPDDRDFVNQAYSESVLSGTPYDLEHRLLLKDGTVKWVHERCRTHYDENGNPLRSSGTTLDITARRVAEEALNRSNRALKAISSCNSVLVHADDEETLLSDMCRVIINEGGYRFAWIGMVRDGEAKPVCPVSHAGFENGYLDIIKVTYSDTEHGRGPAGRAIRTGRISVVRDTQEDPDFAPWRDAALERGYRSVLALPLKNKDKDAFAVLCIYAGEVGAFGTEALTLMQELASDIAYGILALRTRLERDHYLQEHRKSDERYKQVLVDTIRAISLTVEKRDPYTAGHQNKVAQLSVAIGREMGLGEDRLEGLRLGAMIHDIGKIYVPAEILNRPGRLTKAEFEIIQSHAEVGFDIIKDVQFPWPVAEMVIQHHERMDGSGYPRGLRGDEILLEARILAVADVVDAITSHRPYRPAVGLDKGLMEIEAHRGTLYDADVVDACLHLMRDKGFVFEEVDGT